MKLFRKFSTLTKLKDSEHLDIFSRLKKLHNPKSHQFSVPLPNFYDTRMLLGLWDIGRSFDEKSFEIKVVPSE
jgi:hypothetical protein